MTDPIIDSKHTNNAEWKTHGGGRGPGSWLNKYNRLSHYKNQQINGARKDFGGGGRFEASGSVTAKL